MFGYLVATRTRDQREGSSRAGGLRRFGDRDPALADAEVERGVDFRVVELHQHVGAADADLRRAEGDEGGDVERADAHHVERRIVGGKAQPAAVLVGVVGRRDDAGARQQRAALRQDAPLGQRQDQRRRDLRFEGGGG